MGVVESGCHGSLSPGRRSVTCNYQKGARSQTLSDLGLGFCKRFRVLGLGFRVEGLHSLAWPLWPVRHRDNHGAVAATLFYILLDLTQPEAPSTQQFATHSPHLQHLLDEGLRLWVEST